MLGQKEIAAVERRAAALRLTMAELCALAGMQQSTWSRARQRGTVREKVVRRLEAALVASEAKANGESASWRGSLQALGKGTRSEEGRGGKEGVRTGRSRGGQ